MVGHRISFSDNLQKLKFRGRYRSRRQGCRRGRAARRPAGDHARRDQGRAAQEHGLTQSLAAQPPRQRHGVKRHRPLRVDSGHLRSFRSALEPVATAAASGLSGSWPRTSCRDWQGATPSRGGIVPSRTTKTRKAVGKLHFSRVLSATGCVCVANSWWLRKGLTQM